MSLVVDTQTKFNRLNEFVFFKNICMSPQYIFGGVTYTTINKLINFLSINLNTIYSNTIFTAVD